VAISEQVATGGQTSFTIAGGYNVGQLQIFANGVLLNSGDFTASNGTSVTVNRARIVGDVMRFHAVSGLFNNTSTVVFTAKEVAAAGPGQQTFTISGGYNVASIQVFLNRTALSSSDYTATNGTTIVLSAGLAATVLGGWILRVQSFENFALVGALPLSGGTITGDLNISGTIRQNSVSVQNIAIAAAVAFGI
jgi:hypothetical protein